MSIQDKLITLEKVLNIVLKALEIITSVVNTILDKLESVGE